MFLFIASVWMTSCGDKADSEPIAKNIQRSLIGPERILQRTGEAYYIAVSYSKDYTDKDQVKLVVDGQEGTLEKEKTEVLTGTSLLFKLPPSQKTGDLTIKLTIDNGQKVYEKEQLLRFVPNYDIATLWENLDSDYYKQFEGKAYRFKDGDFGVAGKVGVDRPQSDGTMDIGIYFLQDLPNDNRLYVPFNPRLNGRYLVTFENSLPKEIRVLHGSSVANQYYSSGETRSEIESIPGIEKISEQDFGNSKEYNYRIGEFMLKLKDSLGETYSVITK